MSPHLKPLEDALPDLIRTIKDIKSAGSNLMLLHPIPQRHQGRRHHTNGQLVIVGVLEPQVQAQIRKRKIGNSTNDNAVAVVSYPTLPELLQG